MYPLDRGFDSGCAMLGNCLDVTHLYGDYFDVKRYIEAEPAAGIERSEQVRVVRTGGVKGRNARQVVEIELEYGSRFMSRRDGVDNHDALVAHDEVENPETARACFGDLDISGELRPLETLHDVDPHAVVAADGVSDSEDEGTFQRAIVWTAPSGLCTRRRRGICPGRVCVAHARHGS